MWASSAIVTAMQALLHTVAQSVEQQNYKQQYILQPGCTTGHHLYNTFDINTYSTAFANTESSQRKHPVPRKLARMQHTATDKTGAYAAAAVLPPTQNLMLCKPCSAHSCTGGAV